MAEKGVPGLYHVLDWRSFQLPRVARSTLSAEGRAASEATDALYYTSLFINACLLPNPDLTSPQAAHRHHKSALVADAKALYDLLVQDELQARLGAEKRAAVEVLVTKQRLEEAFLWIPWTRGITSRTILRDQGTQTDEPTARPHVAVQVDLSRDSVDLDTQTDEPTAGPHAAVQVDLPRDSVDSDTQTLRTTSTDTSAQTFGFVGSERGMQTDTAWLSVLQAVHAQPTATPSIQEPPPVPALSLLCTPVALPRCRRRGLIIAVATR